MRRRSTRRGREWPGPRRYKAVTHQLLKASPIGKRRRELQLRKTGYDPREAVGGPSATCMGCTRGRKFESCRPAQFINKTRSYKASAPVITAALPAGNSINRGSRDGPHKAEISTPKMKVTFDTKTLERAVSPDQCKPGHDHDACAVVNEAIRAGRIAGYFSEAIVALDGLRREQKVDLVGNSRIESGTEGTGRFELTITMGPRW